MKTKPVHPQNYKYNETRAVHQTAISVRTSKQTTVMTNVGVNTRSLHDVQVTMVHYCGSEARHKANPPRRTNNTGSVA